jgi:hypothetical protein
MPIQQQLRSNGRQARGDGVKAALRVSIGLPSLTALATPATIGVLACWALMLAIPTAFIRHSRRRHRRAGWSEVTGVYLLGAGVAPAGSSGHTQPVLPGPSGSRHTAFGALGWTASPGEARSAVSLRRLPPATRTQGVRARAETLNPPTRSVADRAVDADRQASQHARGAQSDRGVRDQRDLSARQLGGRSRQPAGQPVQRPLPDHADLAEPPSAPRGLAATARLVPARCARPLRRALLVGGNSLLPWREHCSRARPRRRGNRTRRYAHETGLPETSDPGGAELATAAGSLTAYRQTD